MSSPWTYIEGVQTLNLCTRWVSGQPQAPAALPPGKNLGTRWIGCFLCNGCRHMEYNVKLSLKASRMSRCTGLLILSLGARWKWVHYIYCGAQQTSYSVGGGDVNLSHPPPPRTEVKYELYIHWHICLHSVHRDDCASPSCSLCLLGCVKQCQSEWIKSVL